MGNDALVPAAQYLRMSTEQQKYSIENQAAAIHAYADRNGFEIVKSYSDAARSGVLFKNRPALRHLLQEAISGRAPFRAILVYDISRWGRFQDSDEAAHYEFLCKRSRIPVHYCAESFANDDSLPSSVMKAVKRAMAAEYSRELGDKVFAAEKHWAELGFKQGGSAGYALHRLMISADGTRKQLLLKGDVKCLQSDRVVLVPGDSKEVECVREIYRLVVEEKRTPFSIARELNRRGITQRGRKWMHQNVYRILTHPKYAGYNIWNRSSRKLGGPQISVPKCRWIIRPGAFEPVIDSQLFQEAQRILAQRTCAKSNEQILNDLRTLLVQNGKLSGTLLNSTPGAPSITAVKNRFKGTRRAFELAGYSCPARSFRGPTT
jgi:DNA invertase Pin-like site-specific DNA recombinase